MKHILGIFLALFVVSGAYAVPATVQKVIDGDSIKVTMADSEGKDIVQEVRLANADSPTFPGHCSVSKQVSQQALNRAKTLMPEGSIVELQNITKGKKSKRIIANVILADGRDVGEILIKEKLAHEYDGTKHQSWCEKEDIESTFVKRRKHSNHKYKPKSKSKSKSSS